MPTVQQVTDYLETIAPRELQESYDNAGLIVGDPATEVTGVLTCLDSTEAVIAEAETRGCNLVVAHHPIVFRGLKSLTGRNYVERTVIEAIRRGIAVYAIHTNLDNVRFKGVNERIAQRLGLWHLDILAPKPNPALDQPVGSGMVGELPEPMSERAFLALVKERMGAAIVRHTELRNKPVKRVALCGGAGSFLLPQARAVGADAFVTADYKYHEFFDAEGQLLIADIGHYESEQFTIELLSELISEKFRTFAVLQTQENTNPVRYF